MLACLLFPVRTHDTVVPIVMKRVTFSVRESYSFYEPPSTSISSVSIIASWGVSLFIKPVSFLPARFYPRRRDNPRHLASPCA
jgi:hypothetical protein